MTNKILFISQILLVNSSGVDLVLKSNISLQDYLIYMNFILMNMNFSLSC